MFLDLRRRVQYRLRFCRRSLRCHNGGAPSPFSAEPEHALEPKVKFDRRLHDVRRGVPTLELVQIPFANEGHVSLQRCLAISVQRRAVSARPLQRPVRRSRTASRI